MKKSEQKRGLVEELEKCFQALNVKQLYEQSDHKTSKDWLAEVAAILKNLDEGDFQAFLNLRQHLYPSIPLPTRKHAAEQIDGFVRQKVAEYKRYDFSYLDREIKDNPEDISNYIHDKELRDRCLDLLGADSKYDRVINQATQVLEDRVRTKAKLTDRLEGVRLINAALNPDSNKTVLKVSNDPDEQQGFCDMCRGIMLAFRNPTHHYLTDKIMREEAFKVCAFIDTLLPLIERATVSTPQTQPKVIQSTTPAAKSRPEIKVGLQDGVASWANYAMEHHVWSSFRVGLVIDNYNGSRADYISLSMTADLINGGKWEANHFIFQGVEKQDEDFRIEASEVKKGCVFISDTLAHDTNKKTMPEIDKKTLKLHVSTRSGEKFVIAFKEDKIVRG